MNDPACGPAVWARRINDVMGARPENIDTGNETNPRPYAPWAEDVMVLAGYAPAPELGPGGAVATIWLACRICGWFLGYGGQCAADYLAAQIDEHKARCAQVAESTREFYAGPGKAVAQ